MMRNLSNAEWLIEVELYWFSNRLPIHYVIYVPLVSSIILTSHIIVTIGISDNYISRLEQIP